MTQQIQFIIDTDPGVDDAIAILMAMASSEIEILGLTTVGGNVPLARATRNALSLLQAASRSDIPVAKGASRPLRGKFAYAPYFHGPSGLSQRLPDPANGPVEDGAVKFLYDQLTGERGEAVLVALGPLTNLAVLLRERPIALEQAKQIVVMGGAVNTPGNVTPEAEFNFYCDPVAADIVLSSRLPITMVDLAACRQVKIGREQALGLKSATPLGRLMLDMLQGWFHRELSREEFEFCDPLAMAIALHPAIATATKVDLDVGIENGELLGATSETGGPGEITLTQDVDSSRFFALFGRLFELR
ncbi:MAG: nucleoside hydrolase [SAR202 cluster bacterium]|nr:nucleoside hydrolase [SAR202 cluster bacterium]|tara:strand:+ start:1983 stop:2891 length:909 start_codon:yes stop_codon:yes gene_type:complete